MIVLGLLLHLLVVFVVLLSVSIFLVFGVFWIIKLLYRIPKKNQLLPDHVCGIVGLILLPSSYCLDCVTYFNCFSVYKDSCSVYVLMIFPAVIGLFLGYWASFPDDIVDRTTEINTTARSSGVFKIDSDDV